MSKKDDWRKELGLDGESNKPSKKQKKIKIKNKLKKRNKIKLKPKQITKENKNIRKKRKKKIIIKVFGTEGFASPGPKTKVIPRFGSLQAPKPLYL